MSTPRDDAARPGKPAAPPRPRAPEVSPACVPALLRERPHWVLWRYELRGRRWTKPPIDPHTGKAAKSNDPDTWGDFESVLARYRGGGYDGIGYVLAGDDGLVGLDLDHCLDPQTGEVEGWAAEIGARFAGTYQERSPSGTGLRIFCLGRLQRAGKGTLEKRIEAYDRSSPRYLTVTGWFWSGGAITPQQEALDWLHAHYFAGAKPAPSPAATPPAGPLAEDDRALVERASGAKNGAKFAALWAGDWQGLGYPSQSEADAALCAELAFWTGGDAGRIDTLFRQSGLMRPKWEGRRGDATYGAQTIAHAIATCHSHYGDRLPPLPPPPYPPDPSPSATPIDLQARRHAREQAEASARAEAERDAREQRLRYRMRDGLTQHWVEGGRNSEPGWHTLINAEIRLLEAIQYDRGGDAEDFEYEFIVEVRANRGTPEAPEVRTIIPRLRLTDAQMDSMAWLTRLMADGIALKPGRNNRELLRYAIHLCSQYDDASRPREVPKRVVPCYAGWYRHAEAWVYLHGGGALTAEGNITDVAANLTDRIQGSTLSHYLLPGTSSDLPGAIRASLQLSGIAPRNPGIGWLLVGAIYRAPLIEALPLDVAIHVQGESGEGKSTVAGICQAHYGAGFERRSLPASWKDSITELEAKGHAGKSLLMVVDDLRLKGSLKRIQEAEEKFERFVHDGVGNQAATGRRPGRRATQGYYPRCAVLSTGEDIARSGHSALARLVVVEIGKGEFDEALVRALLADARDGRLAESLGGYIQWLQPQMDALVANLPGQFESLCNRYRGELHYQHRREPANLAHYLLGIHHFLLYALARDALTADEADALYTDAEATLRELMEVQADTQREEHPTRRFLTTVAAALRGGLAHLNSTGEDGGTPEGLPGEANRHFAGWRLRASEEGHRRWEPGGRFIGYVEDDRLLFDPALAFPFVNEYCAREGQALGRNATAFWRAMDERGLLLELQADHTEKGAKRLTARRYVAGVRRRFYVVPRAALDEF